MSKLQRSLLFSILLFALIIRLIGIPWGTQIFDKYVGSSRYHPDELKITSGAESFPEDIFLRTDLRYPTAFHYTIGILGLPIKLAVKQAAGNFNELQLYLLLGRLVSTIFGVAGIYLTYLLAKKLANVNSGFIAAGLLAVSLYYVRESSVSTTDIATSFWAVVILLLATKITPASGWKTYIALGVVSGILVGTKYSGAFALIPLGIWLITMIYPAPSRNVRNKILLLLGLSIITGLITFLATTPSILIRPGAFLDSLNYESQRVAQLRSPWWDYSILVYFFTSLTQATNLFICIAIIAALIATVIKRPNIHLVAYAILILCFYLYFNTALLVRYWTLVLPPACILAGWGIERLISASNKILMFLGISILVLCLTTGIYENYLLGRLLFNDTRTKAAQFISQLPANSTFLLGLNSTKADRWEYPFVEHIAKDPSDLPDYVILSDFSNDKFPDNGMLDIKIQKKNISYQEIAVFAPIDTLKVEFLSPTIEIFKLDK
jgi:hypothetical protein